MARIQPYDLGVLFVHGIGEQQQGSTLLQFGEPIIETLRRWYMRQTGLGVDCVRVADSVLLPAKNYSTIPAHSVIEFDFSGKGAEKRWLLAEDWWGDQVVVPESSEFLSWLMTRGSWIALLHSMERLTDDPSTQGEINFYKNVVMSRFAPVLLRKWFANPKNQALANGMLSLYAKPWVLARWMLIALALQIPLTFAYLVTLLPIPSISKWVTNAVRKLASVLGDSFVLVKLESQRGAILSHFEQSLRHMNENCEYVAVIAHSQGTAVVCDVLRTKPGLRPDLLVTFGSGVAKLDQLYLAEAGRRLSLTLAGFIPGIWLLFIIGLLTFPLMNHLVAFSILAVLLILWSGLTAFVLFHTLQSRGDLIDYYESSGASQMLATVWQDYNATRDPVPSAPLAETFGGGRIWSTMIQNRRSFLFDHTSYFSNFAEFVFPIAQLLAVFGDTPPATADVTTDAKELEVHHRRMVLLLPWTLYLTNAAAILEAYLFWPRFESFGVTIWDNLSWDMLPSWLHPIESGMTLLEPTMERIPATATQWKGVFATALLLLILSLYRKIFGHIWGWWNLQAMESSIQYKKRLRGWRSIGQLAWLSFVAFVPLIVVFLVLRLTR